MATENDIKKIKKIIEPVLGQKAWGAKLGVGSFVTIEFGNRRPNENDNSSPHGEWHLWIYCCAWRLEKGMQVLAASEDDRSKLSPIVERLSGLILQDFEVFLPGLDARIAFEDEVVLKLFPIFSEGFEHWMLFTPDGQVLTIGEGTSWSLESASNISSFSAKVND